MTNYTAKQYKHFLGIVSSVIPQLYLIWVLIDVWRFPLDWDDGQGLYFSVTLIAVEFILLHSGVFMSSVALGAKTTQKRFFSLLGLFLFYGIFVVVFSYNSYSGTIIWVFAGILIGRFITLIIAVDEGEIVNITQRSVYGLIIYALLVPASIFLPIPKLGITSQIARTVFPNTNGESGIWTQHPERGIAMAVSYFVLMGLLELFYFSRNNQEKENVSTLVK